MFPGGRQIDCSFLELQRRHCIALRIRDPGGMLFCDIPDTFAQLQKPWKVRTPGHCSELLASCFFTRGTPGSTHSYSVTSSPFGLCSTHTISLFLSQTVPKPALLCPLTAGDLSLHFWFRMLSSAEHSPWPCGHCHIARKLETKTPTCQPVIFRRHMHT